MNERDDILIDRYLRGILTDDDKSLMDKRLTDIVFKENYDEATLLLEVLKEEDSRKLKIRMDNIEKEEFGATKASTKSNPLKIAMIILTLLLVATLMYFILNPSSKVDEREIYASFYEPYPNIVDPIVKGESDAFSVYQYYELKDYSKVIQMLASKTNLSQDEQFYLASSLQASGNYQQATSYFEILKESEKYRDPSQWYLGLICIKENRDCTQVFSEIATDRSNIYSKKATELLEVLGK